MQQGGLRQAAVPPQEGCWDWIAEKVHETAPKYEINGATSALSRYTTWKAKTRVQRTEGQPKPEREDDEVCWVSDFLPEDLPPRIRKNIRVFFYNYDSYWKRDAAQIQLVDYGKDLFVRLKSELRQTNEERGRKLIFVGHSYGGLVIKQALVEAFKDPDARGITEHTKAVLFLGTPHRGSRFSSWGSKLAYVLRPRGANHEVLLEIAYDSSFLRRLHNDFVRLWEHLKVFNYFEQRPTSVFKLWFWQEDSFCVTQSSASYSGPRVEERSLNTDHTGLNKFASRDGNYNALLSNLLDIILPILSPRNTRCHSVPFRSVHTYAERSDKSVEIRRKLEVEHPESEIPYALAIHGAGGTGKTQLALRYIESHHHLYNTILWVDAENEEKLVSSFERCASDLGLEIEYTSGRSTHPIDSAAVQETLKWLKQAAAEEDSWLVIFDNADDFTWGIKNLIPRGKKGHILITSRDSYSPKLVDGGSESLQIDLMQPSEARTILLNHVKTDDDTATETLLQYCDTLTETLGYLPLAVDMAGAYISNEPDIEFALQDYAKNFDRHQDHLLQSQEFLGLQATDKTVWTVWDTTLAKIKSDYHHTRPDLFLAFLACFRGTIIEEEIFRFAYWTMTASASFEPFDEVERDFPDWLGRILKDGEEDWDSFNYRAAIKPLLRYGLLHTLNADRPGVRIHSLVRWRANKYEQGQSWDTWYYQFITAACLPINYPKQRDSSQQSIHSLATVRAGRFMLQAEKLRLPHVSGMQLQPRDISDDRGKRAFIFDPLAAIHYSGGRFQKTETLWIMLLRMDPRFRQNSDASILSTRAWLAQTCLNHGQFEIAEWHFKENVNEARRLLGAERPVTLARKAEHEEINKRQEQLHQSGMSLPVMPETEKAVDQGQIERFKSLSEDELLLVAVNITFNYSGVFITLPGAQDEDEMMRHGTHMAKSKNVENAAVLLSTRIKIYVETSIIDIERSLQVLAEAKQLLGDSHPDTLLFMTHLAYRYDIKAEWDLASKPLASKLYTEILQSSHYMFHHQDPDALIFFAQLGNHYMVQEEWTKAKEIYVPVFEEIKRIFGDEAPITINAIASLGVIALQEKNWPDFENFGLQLKEALEKKHEDRYVRPVPNDPNNLIEYADQYMILGYWDLAEEVYLQILEAKKGIPDGQDYFFGYIVAQLAVLYSMKDEWLQLKDPYSRAMDMAKRELGDRYPRRRDILGGIVRRMLISRPSMTMANGWDWNW
ncbi:MAG: hypothetical protein Q9218_004272 [Villophora microphyllina]